MNPEHNDHASSSKERSSRSLEIRSNLLLVLTAFIWGMAFVAQSVGMDYVGPFTFTAARNYIAPLVLLPFIIYTGRRNRDLETAARGTEEDPLTSLKDPSDNKTYAAVNGRNDPEYAGSSRKTLLEQAGGRAVILGGFCAGTALACASCLQQIGIQYTTVGKAGFITAMYILIVPLLGLFAGRRVSIKVWAGVAIAIAGLYLLCMSGGFSISFGDVMLLLCALGFSLQILSVDYFSPRVNSLWLSMIQFIVAAAESTILALIFEHPSLSAILSAWQPVLYAGALSSGVGYTLQIVAQKNTDPVIASLIMSLESAFSLLSGWLILHQSLSPRELCGCALMFVAIMLAQMPSRRRSKETS